jgi:hypothetical protein
MWADSSLAKLFVTASPTPSMPHRTTTTTPPSAKDNDSNTNTSSMSIGAIVGGVVGGISGVVAISLILIFYHRRRKARNLKSTSTAVEEGKKAELPTRTASSNQQKGAIELDHDQTRRNFAFELDGLGRGRLREKKRKIFGGNDPLDSN